MLSDEVKKSIEESILCWLATADSKGMPNVSPKEVFLPYGKEEIIIANIASPKSVKNIAKSLVTNGDLSLCLIKNNGLGKYCLAVVEFDENFNISTQIQNVRCLIKKHTGAM